MPKYDDDELGRLRDGLRIERDLLDEEVIAQPNDFYHAAEGHALAVSRRDRKKLDLEVEVAQLDKDVREAMTAEGEKMTETLVKAQISRERDYQRAYKAYLDACLTADRWQALRDAYRQRADMLRGLIQLHQSGYFGEVVGSVERHDAHARLDEKRRS